jgi:hypothetical protein
MGKRVKHFERVEEYTARFRKLSTEKLQSRLNSGYPLIKEAGIAIRQILGERSLNSVSSREAANGPP